MYRILYNGESLTNQRAPEFAFAEGELSQKVNTVDSFGFLLPAKHPLIGFPEVRAGVVKLYFKDKPLFAGDILNVTRSFLGAVQFTCQGALGWLHDVVLVRPQFSGTVQSAWQWLITQYNAACSENRKIVCGTCNVSGNHVFDYQTDFAEVFDLAKKLIEAHGGYVNVRYEGEDIILDYVADNTRVSGQYITFGQNLTDLQNFIDGDALFSRIYPTGKDGIDISSVNSGAYYLENTFAKALHGDIGKAVKFDIDTPAALKTAAEAYLAEQALATQTLTLTAFDLSLLDSTIDSFEVGDSVRVRSPAHGIDTQLKVSEKITSLTSPANSKVTLGRALKGISDITA